MKWSWKVGTVSGIDIRIHATLGVVALWIGASAWLQTGTLEAALSGLAFFTALFGSIALHELGHAWAASRFGIRTEDITLLPIGGLARLARMPEKPMQEMVVAAAGPAVNAGIIAAIAVWLTVSGNWEPLSQLHVATGPFLERLLAANAWLALFNLIPAFPMDGGRILRAALATRMSYARATRIAASIGQGLALLLAIVGLFGNTMLLFIALFVWIGAAQEAGSAELRSRIEGVPTRNIMITDFRVLDVDDTLDRAARLTIDTSQKDFPVVSSGHVQGILYQSDLLVHLAANGPDSPVAAAMQREFPQADPADSAARTLEAMQDDGLSSTLLVMHDGKLEGLVTVENIAEYALLSEMHRDLGSCSPPRSNPRLFSLPTSIHVASR